MYIVIDKVKIQVSDIMNISPTPTLSEQNYEQQMNHPEDKPETKENYIKENYRTSIWSEPIVIVSIVLIVILVGFFIYIWWTERSSEDSDILEYSAPIEKPEIYQPDTTQEVFLSPGADITIKQEPSEFDKLLDNISTPTTPVIMSQGNIPYGTLNIPEIRKSVKTTHGRSTRIKLGDTEIDNGPMYSQNNIFSGTEKIPKKISSSLPKHSKKSKGDKKTSRLSKLRKSSGSPLLLI